MENSEIRSFIDATTYDFETIDHYLQYGRIEETMPVMLQILARIRTFKFNGLFQAPPFRLEGLILEKDLEALDYESFIRVIRAWTFKNIAQLKDKTKTAQEKQIEMLLVVLGGCVIVVSCLFIFNFLSFFQTWGLKGDFYEGKHFGKHLSSQVSKMINFSYYLEMDPRLPHEQDFSARWTGYLLAPRDGNFVLSLVVDDGARLYIDDKLIIDAWYDNDSVEFNKSVYLTQGPHAIRIEYYNNVYGVALRLFWTPPGGSKEIIPAYYLRQNEIGL